MPSANNSTGRGMGKIKLQDNDDDKNNICAIKDPQSRSSPATANVPSKVKGKCESRSFFAYLSVAALILILCPSVLFIGRMYRHKDDVAAFRRHLTSEFAVEEIQRISRNVIQEELRSLFNSAVYENANARGSNLRDHYRENPEEEEFGEGLIKNERKIARSKRNSNHVLGQQQPHHHHNPQQQQQQPQPADQPSGPVVEFFNPKLRHELEKKDVDYMKRTGAKGAAPGGEAWVWLTSYSRIPAEAITGFCRATKEYCPPGPPGHPGIPGPKGNRGDVGLPGPPGMDGKEGGPGPRGPIGQRGLPGTAGLDGRDGVPGEPGLDGIPGRAGADGVPGRHGKDGIPGTDGRNGDHGKDGAVGPIGPPGPPGIGEKGLSGPRGRPGKGGTNGTPGIPGINAWKVKVNGSYSSELLIPPSISGNGLDYDRAILVREGDNLRLRCAATGMPKPDIEWQRLDNRPISYGSWEASSMSGHTLNITKVQRTHMGIYRCFADNGVPPAANATFNLEVQFEPLIRVRNQNVQASNGTRITLECEVEAFPDPIRYWERVSDGRLLEDGLRYQIGTTNDGSYKSTMQLNMSIMSAQDYGDYHCVSKNELGTTKGVFHVRARNPLIRPLPEIDPVVVFGNLPPPKVTLDDLCPPPVQCKDCPDPKEKCKDTIVSLHDLIGLELEITPTGGRRYPGLNNRTMDCVLYAVGKPVYLKASGDKFGAWMKDPSPFNDIESEKFWVTRENITDKLFEFANKDDFRKNVNEKIYRLDRKFHGNAHTVFNGSFYYQEQDKPNVIRYMLRSERRTSQLEIPYAIAKGPKHLYTTEHNYFDFNVDENGLWIIYGLPDSNNTIVTKLGTLSSSSMDIQYSWNISVNHRKVGEMFIVCGVLYAIDSTEERVSKIRLVLDLYNSKLLDPTLTFANPFRMTTAVAYNFKAKELFTWDRGNQLTYPIRYHSIGYDATSGEKGGDDPQMASERTGVSINDKDGVS